MYNHPPEEINGQRGGGAAGATRDVPPGGGRGGAVRGQQLVGDGTASAGMPVVGRWAGISARLVESPHGKSEVWPGFCTFVTLNGQDLKGQPGLGAPKS